MAYQSLYRIWRPLLFSDMVGQDSIVRALSNQAAAQRVAHAYLFCGSRGTGKTSAARIMAMAINCLSLKEGNPCLQCDHCLSLMKETTLDVFEMDAASNSRVEEIREMLSRIDYPPQFVRYKVYIIDEVHMLSNAAFNALLKTLEEPPEYMVFILATTEPQKLPATILSRCQRFDFRRIAEKEIVSRMKLALVEGVRAEENALHLIAASSEGSMRDAWSLMDMCLGMGNYLTESSVRDALGAVSRGFLLDYLNALSQSDAGRVLNLTDQLMRDGRDIQVFLRDLSGYVREALWVKWTGSSIREMSQDQLESLKTQALEIGPDILLQILEKCMQAETDARWASSPRAVLELFALRICQMRQDSGQGALAARMSLLENMFAEKADFAPEKSEIPGMHAVLSSPHANGEKTTHAPQPGNPDNPDNLQASADPEGEPAEPLLALAELSAENNNKPVVSPKDAWNNMLGRLSTMNPGLYAMLHRGKYGGFGDGVFMLTLSGEDEILSHLLNQDERASLIARLLSEEMGKSVRFTAGGMQQAQRNKNDSLEDENIVALAEAFGRDKIIVKKGNV